MTIYILAYAAMIFLAAYLKKHNINKKVFCWIVFIMWAAIIGLRHPTMGVDLHYGASNGYWGMFSYIGNQSWENILNREFLNYERGYVIFNKILNYLSDDAQILLLIAAVLEIGVIVWLIYKYSKFPLNSMVVYIALPAFMIVFSGMRQALAIAITIYSFRFIKEKKLIPFIIAVLLANQFHSSAILFLGAYPIYYVRTEKVIYKIASILVLPVVFVFREPLFNIMVRFLGENDKVTATNAFMLFVFFVLIYVFCLLLEDKSNEEQIGCRNLFYMACICQAFSGVSNLAMRVGYYYMIYLVLLFPEIMIPQKAKTQFDSEMISFRQKEKDKNNFLLMYSTILAFFTLWGIYSLSTSTWAETNPHSFFWQ